MAVLGGSLYATAPAAARARQVAQVDTPLEHLIISCEENRSFDHYFGYAPQVQAAGFGPPPATRSRTRAGTRTSRSSSRASDARPAAPLERGA